MRSPKLIMLMALAVLIFTPGCALINLVVEMPTPTPVAQRPLRPTFTPTPIPPPPAPAEQVPIAVDVPAPAADNQAAAPADQPTAAPAQVAAAAPTEPPTPEPTPTEQPTPEPTATPIATPTPFVVVQGDRVNARSGPGASYDLVGELLQGTQLSVIGKDEDGAWWQVCCLNEQQVWVSGELVAMQGSAETIAVAANIPPSPTLTNTLEPKPYAIVRNPRVNVRSGPGTDFAAVGQAQQGARLEIVGRNQAGDWWQVCCVNGQKGWISDELVSREGPVERVALSPDLPTPTPPAQPTATAAPVAAGATVTPIASAPEDTTAYPWALTTSERFPFGGNDYLRVAAKVTNAANEPLGNTYLRIRNDTTGQEWLSRQSGSRAWEYSAPSADFGDFREVNVQFDTDGLAPLLGKIYSVWLVDGSGKRVSPIASFEPGDDEPQWLYVVFTRK